MSVDCPWPSDLTERGWTEPPLRPSSCERIFGRLRTRNEHHEAANIGTEVNLNDPGIDGLASRLRGEVGVQVRGRFDPYPNVTRSDQG
jgi:hypothetical protein